MKAVRVLRHIPFRWMIRWNKDKTEGEVWRMFDWPTLPKSPPAPYLEGHIKRGVS